MLNRRHLRIKVLQILYSYYQDSEKDITTKEKELTLSLSKSYDMYIMLFLLTGEMQRQAIDKIDLGMNKKMPSHEELHPNTKFVTNFHLRTITNSKNLKKIAEERHLSWGDDTSLVRKVFSNLTESESYKEYMESGERGFEHDKEYILRFFKRELINNELLADYFEERSIFWNDDLDIIASMVLKTMKLIEEDAADFTPFEQWQDKEDEQDFVYNLYRQCIHQDPENMILIDELIKNWDMDRLAIMDTILMKMALAEAKTFETIPLKVTLNEYIELSKYYSLPKSSGFINGVLDQAFEKLKIDGKTKKVGRGLI